MKPYPVTGVHHWRVFSSKNLVFLITSVLYQSPTSTRERPLVSRSYANVIDEIMVMMQCDGVVMVMVVMVAMVTAMVMVVMAVLMVMTVMISDGHVNGGHDDYGGDENNVDDDDGHGYDHGHGLLKDGRVIMVIPLSVSRSLPGKILPPGPPPSRSHNQKH